MAYNNFENHSWKKMKFVFFFFQTSNLHPNKQNKQNKEKPLHFVIQNIRKKNQKKIKINKHIKINNK